MGADRRDSRTNATTTTGTSETTRATTPQVKAEVACVGTTLSADDRARYMREGRCFGCGKPGHRSPECPDGKPRAYLVLAEAQVKTKQNRSADISLLDTVDDQSGKSDPIREIRSGRSNGITTTRKEESQQLLAYPAIARLSVRTLSLPAQGPAQGTSERTRLEHCQTRADVVGSNSHVDEITSNTDIPQHLKLQV